MQPIVKGTVGILCFHRHIILTSDAEVTFDRATTHWTTIQFVEATGTYAGMPEMDNILILKYTILISIRMAL